MSQWRDYARQTIAQVLADTKGMSEIEIRKALKDAYPFGERKYHPYKIWLSEIAIQTKKKRFGQKKQIIDKNQQTLF
jgi:hypothetical protein